MSATDFKARCLKILDELDAGGLIITKRGQPVAELRPIRSSRPASLIGSMAGKIEILGDIFSTGVPWDAQS